MRLNRLETRRNDRIDENESASGKDGHDDERRSYAEVIRQNAADKRADSYSDKEGSLQGAHNRALAPASGQLSPYRHSDRDNERRTKTMEETNPDKQGRGCGAWIEKRGNGVNRKPCAKKLFPVVTIRQISRQEQTADARERKGAEYGSKNDAARTEHRGVQRQYRAYDAHAEHRGEHT